MNEEEEEEERGGGGAAREEKSRANDGTSVYAYRRRCAVLSKRAEYFTGLSDTNLSLRHAQRASKQE